MERYTPPVNEDEKILQRRVTDMVKAVCHSGVSRYTGFLNDREQTLALAALQGQHWRQFRLDGGYPGAERAMLCVFEDDRSVRFPIKTVEITAKGAGGQLTHRDYLGAMLALGLERDCLGDILVQPGSAVVVVQERVRPLLLNELREIGRFAVTLAPCEVVPEQKQDTGRTGQASVASLRLDAVLAAMLGLSRNGAAALVAQGAVQVNHLPVSSTHYSVNEGDVFSIRGTGKLRLVQVGGQSRKKRTWIEFIQY